MPRWLDAPEKVRRSEKLAHVVVIYPNRKHFTPPSNERQIPPLDIQQKVVQKLAILDEKFESTVLFSVQPWT